MKLSGTGLGVLALISILLTPLYSQENIAADKFLDQVLYVDIKARLLSGEGESLWQMENKAYTISGRTVDVRLEGSNILAISRLTPYTREDETVLLVAQGEVWYTRSEDEGMKYYSGMTSIPVALGESALFFPLGVRPKKTEGAFILEIEITVDLYTRLTEKP